MEQEWRIGIIMVKIIKVIGILLALLINTSIPVKAQAPDLTKEEKIVSMTVIEMINEIAPQFGQDPRLISKISYCESNHIVVSHDGGRGKNITGIHDTTFNGWLPLYQEENHETLNKGSTYDQIKMMSWAFSKGSPYKNQWTTYVAYTKGGTYSFYSKLLKAHFTVRCK